MLAATAVVLLAVAPRVPLTAAVQSDARDSSSVLAPAEGDPIDNPIDVFVLVSDESMNAFANYFSDFTADGGAEGAFRRHDVTNVSSFFRHGLKSVPAGSVVIVGNYGLQEPSLEMPATLFLENRLLSEPRLWALLNHSEPLNVILAYDDVVPGTLDGWPRETHHVLYRTMWCAANQRDWLNSLQAEWPIDAADAATRAGGDSWPWLRSFPFGTSMNNGSLAALRGERRPVSDRSLLASFQGSGNNKPAREALGRAAESQLARLRRVANRTVGSEDGYLLSVYDANNPPPDRPDYLELLRSSIFSPSPAGDMWECYRTWEILEAGSIPIVQDMPTYRQCASPAAHFISEVDGGIVLSEWEELPDVLERETADMARLQARQDKLLGWLREYKTNTTTRLLQTARRMRRSAAEPHVWKRRTRCEAVPLSPMQLAKHYASINEAYTEYSLYQPYNVTADTPGALLIGDIMRLAGRICESPMCAPPLLADFRCGVAS